MDRELMDLAALVRRYPIEKHELPPLPEYREDRNDLTLRQYILHCVTLLVTWMR